MSRNQEAVGRVGVLMGGMSSEREISLRTGRAICAALKRSGYDAVEVDVDESLPARLVDLSIDVAVVALHGPLGEDGCVQGLLEVMGIPYSGSGVLASAAAMDKRFAKEIMTAYGIPTPPWVEVHARSVDAVPSDLPFGYPVVVKPAAQGSTVGIHIVHDPADLLPALRDSARHDDRLLIEAYVAGIETTVGVIDDLVLPVIEIEPPEGFYDFEAKYTPGRTRFHIPARVSERVALACRDYARRAYEALGCEGVARVDFRVDEDGDCWVLEVNTIPGMTETSLVPKAAAHIGMTFEQVCVAMVEGARRKVRPGEGV